MRITSLRSHRQSGSVLAVTLLTTLIIGIALTGYLVLVANNNQSGMRSGAWNAAIPVAEAGAEEALAHLDQNYPTNLLAAGWALDGTNLVRTRTLGDDTYTVRLSISPNPIIESSGSVLLPWNRTYVTRTLRIQTLQTGIVLNALATKEEIKLNGFTFRSDSFDSEDRNHSTPTGQYDPTMAKDGGDIATNLGIEGAFDAGNAQIYGKVATGPGGTVTPGPTASIGSEAWHDGGNTGIESGWVSDDCNVIMPDVEAPYAAGIPPAGGFVGPMRYTYILGSDNYELSNFGGKVLVTGHATLLVRDRVQFTGLDFIMIAPGGSLRLYVEAASASIGGLGIINATGIAANFSYYGLPSNTSVSIGGGAGFTGLIYAPNAALSLNGGGHVSGAVMCRSASVNGAFSFHFDEALGRSLAFRRFAITSWDEI